MQCSGRPDRNREGLRLDAASQRLHRPGEASRLHHGRDTESGRLESIEKSEIESLFVALWTEVEASN
jgi:hypothetical protein